jgi:hypothetical protein
MVDPITIVVHITTIPSRILLLNQSLIRQEVLVGRSWIPLWWTGQGHYQFFHTITSVVVDVIIGGWWQDPFDSLTTIIDNVGRNVFASGRKSLQIA